VSFRCRINYSRDGAERTDAGKLFHVRGPVTGNERSPTVTNLDRGTKTISVSADDLSLRLQHDDNGYGGARSWSLVQSPIRSKHCQYKTKGLRLLVVIVGI